MGLFGNHSRVGASAASSYEIERSLRHNSNDTTYFNRTPSSTTNRTTFTFSVWVKFTASGATPGGAIFGVWQDNTSRDTLRFTSGNINFQCGQHSENATTTAVFRDPTAWYHIVCAVDSTQAASADRVVIYVNGVSQALGTNTISQDREFKVNTNNIHVVGCRWLSGAYDMGFNGYIAEFNFIDGSKLAPSSFGETDAATGQWVPKKYGGSYGTNGYYLNFSDNSGTTATTLGKDSSGNGNNFTPNNYSVAAGAGNDSLVDTPTNNFCTGNSLSGRTTNFADYSNGNLDFSIGGTEYFFMSTMLFPNSGKWYVECVYTTVATGRVGVSDYKAQSWGPDDGTGHWAGIAYLQDGIIRVDDSNVQTGLTSVSDNDIVGIAVDRDAGTVQFSINGTNKGSAVNISSLDSTEDLSFHVGRNGSAGGSPVGSVNFGQRAFGNQPSGFLPLCTANLPTPTVKNGTDYFNTILYTGNATTRSLTGVGFQPDFTWIKMRSDTEDQQLYDSVRGTTKDLRANLTNIENANVQGLNSFNADGFSVGNMPNVNQNTKTFAAWNWKGGGTASSNGDGTITTSVSANASAGFSIISYAGNGLDNATIGHGLGVAPSFVVIKDRDSNSAGNNWYVFHSSLASGHYLKLNSTSTTAAVSGTSNGGIGSVDSDTVNFTQGSSDNKNVNESGDNFIAYCFSNVDSYLKAGSYKGNGNAAGTFVYTEFKPAFVMIKRTNEAASWVLHDNKRAGYNVDNDFLHPDLNQAESDGSGGTIDLLANGFKCRDTTGWRNESSDTYIYLAFAERPFKYANAR